MKFTKPNPLNAETLIKELSSIGIDIEIVLVNAEGELVLDVKDKDKTKVQTVLNNHKGEDSIDPKLAGRQAIFDKLGLTADEAAILLG
jgi:hypothetical protein